MVDVVWFAGDEDITDALLIRRRVFVEEQHVPEELEFISEEDERALHVVVYNDGEAVATGRILLDIVNNDCMLGRIAVMPEHRGHSYGGLIVRLLACRAYDLGYEEQHLHAQISARGFYEKLGFVAYGEEFDDAGIPHIAMRHYGDY